MKIRSKIFRNKFREHFTNIFGTPDDLAFEELSVYFEWIEILSGEWLFKQGDPGDSLYILINGRLQVVIDQVDGIQSVVADITRGETVGEMAIFTEENRSASVKAIRDSILVKLNKEDFDRMIKDFPGLGSNITKLIISRLKRQNLMQRYKPRYVSIAILPISESVDHQWFCEEVRASLVRRNKSVLLLTLNKIKEMLGSIGLFGENDGGDDDYLRLSQWLDEQETLHDYVLYAADRQEDAWTRKCLRHADEVLLIANAADSCDVSAIERSFLWNNTSQIMANLTLVLLHAASSSSVSPKNTKAWLKDRAVNSHRHLWEGDPKAFDRLGRFICGETNGLVLSGGGAKGIAHLGVFRALQESGLHLDMIGGTSIGAVFGGLIAQGMNAKDIRFLTRKMFLRNPTPLTDYNVFPMVSLLKGKTLDRMLQEVFKDIHIEDLWLDFFCVAGDLSKIQPVVFNSGFLQKAIRASISIPAIFPPVIHRNSLLIDGGVINNFPIDLMAERGAGKIIGVFLNQEKETNLNYDKVPGTWDLFKDRYLFRKRRYRLPSMVTSIVQSTTLNSNSRSKAQLENVDLLFCPDLTSFNLLAWNKYDKIEEAGYRHAVEVLEKVDRISE